MVTNISVANCGKYRSWGMCEVRNRLWSEIVAEMVVIAQGVRWCIGHDRIVVSTSRCGRDNPGSNPGHGRAVFSVTAWSATFWMESWMPLSEQRCLWRNARKLLWQPVSYQFLASAILDVTCPNVSVCMVRVWEMDGHFLCADALAVIV